MPASLKKIDNAYVILGRCEVCGASASFGTGLNFRLVLKFLEKGDKVRAKENLGKWFCGSCWKSREQGKKEPSEPLIKKTKQDLFS